MVSLKRYLKHVSEDRLQHLVISLLQDHNTVDLNGCGSKEEKIERVSKAYLDKQNPSWTDLHRALCEAKCNDAAEYVETTFLPV